MRNRRAGWLANSPLASRRAAPPRVRRGFRAVPPARHPGANGCRPGAAALRPVRAARQADGHAALQARGRPGAPVAGTAGRRRATASRPTATARRSRAAVLLHCRPSRRRSAERCKPARPSGIARTKGLPPSPCSIAAATTKSPLRRLVTHGRRPSRRQPVLRVRHHLQRLDPGKELHRAGRRPVAPAGGRPAGRRAGVGAVPWLGHLQQVLDEGALAPEDERRGQRAPPLRPGRSTASASAPPAPPRRSSTATPSTPAAARRGSSAAGSASPRSRASAWRSSQSLGPRVWHGRHSLRRRGMPPGKRRLRPAGWSSDIAPARH